MIWGWKLCSATEGKTKVLTDLNVCLQFLKDAKRWTASVAAIDMCLLLTLQDLLSFTLWWLKEKSKTNCMLCVQYMEAEALWSFLLYIILEKALKISSSLWVTCISCKYSFIDFYQLFFLFLQTNKHHAPLFKLCTWHLWEFKLCRRRGAEQVKPSQSLWSYVFPVRSSLVYLLSFLCKIYWCKE